MPSRHELVAYQRDEKDIAEAIGADLVIFQKLSDLIASVRQFNPKIEVFDCSVFSGEYVTGGVDEAYLQHLEQLRSDNARVKSEGVHGSNLVNGAVDGHGANLGCSGPMNGADDTVGLYNSWQSYR